MSWRQKRPWQLIPKDFWEDLVSSMAESEKISRKTEPRKDYWESLWGKWLLDPSLQIPGSRASKDFRRRFRVPYPLFKEVLVPQCINEKIASTAAHAIPMEFRVLIVLRILGAGATYSDCSDCSNVGTPTVAVIFSEFSENFVSKFYAKFVYFPEGRELLNALEVYRKLGFPGCVGSIDCTHIDWRACKKKYRFEATGKEGHPTLSFQAVVNHDRFVYSISSYFFGACNDMTISRNDSFITDIRTDSLDNIEYVLYNEDGNPQLCRGGYLLSDKGYPRRAMFMAPDVDSNSTKDLHWSETLESVRKDVECFFGVAKSRWWFLRHGSRMEDPVVTENAFRMAAILHNMLLAYDGLMTECGNNTEEFWSNLCPIDEDEVVAVVDEVVVVENSSGSIECSEPHPSLPVGSSLESSAADESNHRHEPHIITMFELESAKTALRRGTHFRANSCFTTLRNQLVNHFHFQYLYGDIWWPRAKLRGLQLPPIDLRVAKLSMDKLYHAESTIVPRSAEIYNLSCGQGLFSDISYCRGDIIAFFNGSFIDEAKKNEISNPEELKYVIKVVDNLYLNCYAEFKRGLCKASYANSSFHAVSVNNSRHPAHENCKLVFDAKSRTVRLVAVTSIAAKEEILWYYVVDH